MDNQWLNTINNAKSLDELESIRVDIFGKKGFLTLEFAKIKSIPNEEKKSLQNLV